MTRTYKANDLYRTARYAKEAREKARHHLDFAISPGFYLPEQEIMDPDDMNADLVRHMLDGRV